MRRSGFSNKKRKPMKRGRLKKKATTELAKLKDKLWELCKKIIRKRDGPVCVICGKEGLKGANHHTGHFIPSASCGAYLRYDLRNLHSSCYYCNINLGGNGAQYYKRLVELYGQPFVDGIFRDKQIITKADEAFYLERIESYTKLSKLSKQKLLEYTKRIGNEETN